MLNMLYHQYQITRVWLDLICINQEDEAELSKQVSQMGEIYKKASKVYAWLGEADRGGTSAEDSLYEYKYDHIPIQCTSCCLLEPSA